MPAMKREAGRARIGLDVLVQLLKYATVQAWVMTGCGQLVAGNCR